MAILPSGPGANRTTLEKQLAKSGFMARSSTVYLGAAGVGAPPRNCVVLEDNIGTLPDWARSALAPVDLQQDYVRLEAALLKMLKSDRELSDLDTVTLRVMMIHQWRRLLLRHADLPADMLPTGWRGEACRSAVLTLHERLSAKADIWLDSAINPPRS